MNRQALILAAGLGTRLRPLTDDRPKALVNCAGKPLLAHVIDQVIQAGCNHIVINVHYFAAQVIEYVQALNISGIKFFISDESTEIKDTGGALVHALPLLQQNLPVLICNTDILTDYNLEQVFSEHETSSASATLVVQQRPSSRKLIFDEFMQLQGWQNNATGERIGEIIDLPRSQWAFSGIHMIDIALINAFKVRYATAPFPIIHAYLASLNHIYVRGLSMSPESWWMDCGTAEKIAVAAAHFSK